MKTGNFDFVCEVSEGLINKGLAALFYSGFMFKKGYWKPKTDKLPNSIKNLVDLKYEVRLKGEPVVDVIQDKKVRLLLTVEAYLTLFEGYELEFDIICGVEGTLAFDKEANKVQLDLTELHISNFVVDNKFNLPEKAFNGMNEILKQIVVENLTGKWELFNMKNPLFLAKLPKMPDGMDNRVPVKFGGLKTFDNNVIACCVNFLEYNGGNINQVANFIGGNNYAVGINESAIHRIFDFWWARTTFEKTKAKDKTYDIPGLATFLGFLAGVVDIAAKLGSLGFLETDFEVKKVWLEYGASITLEKPNFDLKDGNILELKDSIVKATVYVRAKANLEASLEVDTSGLIPDWLTPWDDDVTISKKTSTMTLFSLTLTDITVKANAAGSVVINPENELEGKINSLNINVDLGSEWYKHLPEDIINNVIKALMKELIIEKLDKFLVFPAIIVKKIPKVDYTVAVDLNLLDVDNEELFAGANISIKELQMPSHPVPKYIANKNPESKEVHRHDCISVQRMNEANKVGYYVLYEAFQDGYDGCKKCIPEYHNR